MNDSESKAVQEDLVRMEPNHLCTVLPVTLDKLVDSITPARDVFVVAHLGIARVNAAAWTLKIGGLIDINLTLSYQQLKDYPKVEVQSFHQCAGFPLKPDFPVRRISNVVWGGVTLAQVLCGAKPSSKARYLWAFGLDSGVYHGVDVDSYAKDIPLEGLSLNDIILAYEMNGAPLSDEHGYPVRLVVPGFYGTNLVKWLSRLEFQEERAPGAFTQKFYNDPVEDSHGIKKGSRPVWRAPPESAIVSPSDCSTFRYADSKRGVSIWGWAWGFNPVAAVEVSFDGGHTWKGAVVGDRFDCSWQRFSILWQPEAIGTYRIVVRAMDTAGNIQPLSPARNSAHSVTVSMT